MSTRTLISSLLVALLLTPTVHAGTRRGGDELSKRVSTYYKHPEPQNIPAILAGWSNLGLLRDHKTYFPALGFFSQVMRDNPRSVPGWLALAESFPAADRSTVFTAAWYSGTPQAREYFRQHGPRKYATETPPAPNGVPVDRPSHLDYYWGKFSASGDPVCIRRVVSAFELSAYSGTIAKYHRAGRSASKKPDAVREATFIAAKWSLGSKTAARIPKCSPFAANCLRPAGSPPTSSTCFPISSPG